MIQGLLDQLRQGEPETPKKRSPKYPSWFRKPPKPDAGDCAIMARKDELLYRRLRLRMADDIQWLRLRKSGVFRGHDAETEQQFISTALVDERNLIVAMLAAGSVAYKHLVADDDADTRQAAQDLEDLQVWLDEEAERAHMERGNGPLAMDEAILLTDYGRIPWKVALDPDAESGLREHLIDPATTYAQYDDRGLCRITRRYRASVRELIAAYDQGDGQVEEKLLGLTDEDRRQNDQQADHEDPLSVDWQVEVTEYYDRWWMCVLVHDEEIIPVTAHKFGFVPFIYQEKGGGSPRFTRTPWVEAQRLPSGELVEHGGGRLEDDVAEMGPSCIHYQKFRHQQHESMMARLVTAFFKSDNPPFFRYRDEFAAEKPMPPVDSGPGGQNEAMLNHEHIEPLPYAPSPELVQPIMQTLSMDRSTGQLPLAAYGANEQSNVSGNALGELSDAGKDKLVSYIETLQLFKAAKAKMRLKLIQDWGHLANNGGGVLEVLRQRPKRGQSPLAKITPETIDKAGTRVQVKITNHRLRDLPMLLNAGAMGIQTGQVSRRETWDWRGVEDPDRLWQEIINERLVDKMLDDPTIVQQMAVQAALKEGLPQLAAKLEQAQAQQPPGGGPGPGGGGPPGPGGPGGPVPPNTSALNLPALGMPPGPGSGPQGPVAPPPPGMPPGMR